MAAKRCAECGCREEAGVNNSGHSTACSKYDHRVVTQQQDSEPAQTADKTMFALTHINSDGMRTLTQSNQGRNHFATEQQAKEYLAAFIQNNSVASLEQIFGHQALGTFEIRPVLCYHHGDAKGVWFDK